MKLFQFLKASFALPVKKMLGSSELINSKDQIIIDQIPISERQSTGYRLSCQHTFGELSRLPYVLSGWTGSSRFNFIGSVVDHRDRRLCAKHGNGITISLCIFSGLGCGTFFFSKTVSK